MECSRASTGPRDAERRRSNSSTSTSPAQVVLNRQAMIPKSWRSRGTALGWAVFVILAAPLLFFAFRLGLSEGFAASKAAAAAAGVVAIALVSSMLGYGLSRGWLILVIVSSVLVLAILVAYGAAISLIVGWIKIRIF